MILIAGDHLATDLVEEVCLWLDEVGIEFKNVGGTSSDTPLPLFEMIPRVAEPIQNSEADFGILVCGTGTGVEIGANRFKKVRASLCIEPKQAEWAREYDNANVLCLSSWITKNPGQILQAWFNNEFDEDPERTQMLKDFDKF